MGGDDISLTLQEAAALRRRFTYCPRCRAKLVDREAFGQMRLVCPECRFVQFIDPKVSCAVLPLAADNRVLLIKRDIEPGRGDWCIPGGFMEINETPQAAAARECEEETGYTVDIVRLLDVFYYRDYRGGGVLIVYLGRISGGSAHPDAETARVGFFGPDELPDNIAFDTNVQLLAAWREGNI